MKRRIPPAFARTLGGAHAPAKKRSTARGRRCPIFLWKGACDEDRAQREAAAGREADACPVRKRQERRGDGAHDGERAGLQHMRAKEAPGRPGKPRPPASGGYPKRGGLRGFPETAGKHSVEQRADRARRVEGPEADRSPERRRPRESAERLYRRCDEERKRGETPVGADGGCDRLVPAVKSDRHEDADRRQYGDEGEESSAPH